MRHDARLLLHRTNCLHPPDAVSFNHLTAVCADCGQTWRRTDDTDWEVARWGRKGTGQ